MRRQIPTFTIWHAVSGACRASVTSLMPEALLTSSIWITLACYVGFIVLLRSRDGSLAEFVSHDGLPDPTSIVDTLKVAPLEKLLDPTGNWTVVAREPLVVYVQTFASSLDPWYDGAPSWRRGASRRAN